eukprot:PhM_4_TR12266/c0_g2_i1/m.52969
MKYLSITVCFTLICALLSLSCDAALPDDIHAYLQEIISEAHDLTIRATEIENNADLAHPHHKIPHLMHIRERLSEMLFHLEPVQKQWLEKADELHTKLHQLHNKATTHRNLKDADPHKPHVQHERSHSATMDEIEAMTKTFQDYNDVLKLIRHTVEQVHGVTQGIDMYVSRHDPKNTEL